MNVEPNPESGPETGPVDEFEVIVAQWRREGDVPEWPTTDPLWLDVDPQAGPTPGEASASEAPTSEIRLPVDDQPTRPQPRVAAARPDRELDDHFVPGEPPPLPRIGPPAMVGAALLGLGLLLVIVPSWLGLSDIYGLPLGLVALAAGLGWLVLRLWPDDGVRDDDEPDDGAVL